MNKKIALLEQWLKANNSNIKNEINNCKDENKYRDIKVGLDVMISVLSGENVTEGSKFSAVENLVGTDNPTVNFIRNASFEELYSELTKASDEKGIKANLSMLNHNKIIDLYEEKKAKGEISVSPQNGFKENQGPNGMQSQSRANIQRENPTAKGFGANSNTARNLSQEPNIRENTNAKDYFSGNLENGNSYNNIRQSSEPLYGFNDRSQAYNSTMARGEYNATADNRAPYGNNYQRGAIDGRDMVEVCGKSLDCKINGVRVVIIPNEDGSYDLKNRESYSQSMELKFNGGRDTQIVNKKVLSREEFNDFVERYREEIFAEDYAYEKATVKENINTFDKEPEL